MDDCLFCKIIRKEIPGDIIYENDEVAVIKDINPVAPVHLLVVPKEHIANMNKINSENSKYISAIFEEIPKIAKNENIDETGYRVISNCGFDAWQAIQHLHFHLIGGRNLGPKIIKEEEEI